MRIINTSRGHKSSQLADQPVPIPAGFDPENGWTNALGGRYGQKSTVRQPQTIVFDAVQPCAEANGGQRWKLSPSRRGIYAAGKRFYPSRPAILAGLTPGLIGPFVITTSPIPMNPA